MDSIEGKNSDANSPPPPVSEPTITIQNPVIEEALARAGKKLTDEDFVQAILIIDHLLETHPGLEPAKKLRDQIQQAAANLSREIFNQGVSCYMECDWDRAIAFWKKSLQIVPNDRNVTEWIIKAERKREQEKLIRADLLRNLEECGKMLSDRNYVVAEEQLEELKNKFTGGFRLADLQRIYEALVVRTRVELEKEFEDLRSNVVEQVHSAPVENMKQPPPAQKANPAPFQKQYMDAFETGKKYFENREWQKALVMWQTARRLNPHDLNLTHWIALAENNLNRPSASQKPSPVRATIVFISVFVITAVLAFLAYKKYADYEQQTKNKNLIQRSIEHYRAGRLEESWKTLQIYVLQDPDNESARTLLERITAEMNARQKLQSQTREIESLLRTAKEQSKSKNYKDSMESYRRIIELDPNHSEARQQYEEIGKLVDSSQATKTVASLLQEAEMLIARKEMDAAEAKLIAAQSLEPRNENASALLIKINTERNSLKGIGVQLEVAKYLYDRNQKDAATLVLNRILTMAPGHPQATQLLSRIRSSPSVPKTALEIRIQPAARLWLDGRDLGFNSYFRLMEPIGSHVIHIESQGFRTVDQPIQIERSGKNQFEFQLKRH